MRFNFGKKKKSYGEQILGETLWDIAKKEGNSYALTVGCVRVTRDMYYLFKVLNRAIEVIPTIDNPKFAELNQVALGLNELEREKRKIQIPERCMTTVLAVEEFVIFNSITGYGMSMKECLDLQYSKLDIRKEFDRYTTPFPEGKTTDDLRTFIYGELLKIYDIVYPRIQSNDRKKMEESFPLYIRDFYQRYGLSLDDLDEYGRKYGAKVCL